MKIDYSDVLRALVESQIPFMVVGGFASVAHGVVRATMDLDLAIFLTDSSLEKIWFLFKKMNFVCRQPLTENQFIFAKELKELMIQKNAKAITFYHKDKPYLVVDLLMGEMFDPMPNKFILMNLFGVNVPVTTLENLIALKKFAGRTKDLEDIRELEIISKQK